MHSLGFAGVDLIVDLQVRDLALDDPESRFCWILLNKD